MKRLFALLLCLLLLAAACPFALADVAFEPADDFYGRHSDECEYINRGFYTNGGEGFARVYSSPESSKPEALLPNGRLFNVSHTYGGDTEKWGCITYDADSLKAGGNDTGWVKMDDMYADYDCEAFDADHASEYVQKAVTLRIGANDAVCCYKYPGSGINRETIKNYTGEPFTELDFTSVFVDPAGREWGFVGYYYGMRDLWICLSDPYNPALTADENCVTISAGSADDPQRPTVGKLVSLTPAADSKTMKQAVKQLKAPTAYIVAGAVAVVVIAAAVLLYVFKKKKAAC